MEQSQLLTGLLSENEDTLRQHVKLWDDSDVWTTLGRLAQNKAVQYLPEELPRVDLDVSGNDDSKVAAFRRLAQSKIDQYLPDNKLPRCDNGPWDELSEALLQDFQLMKLSRLLSAAKVSFPRNPTRHVLHEKCLEVEQRAISDLAKDDENFKGATTSELTAFIMNKMFSEFTEKFHDAPQDQQEDIAEQLLDAVDQLDDADRQRFLDELGVEELSKVQLKKLIASGAFASAFAASVSVAGFTAYLAVTTALAAVSALIGITFPFIVYIYATAAMAFLTDPIVLITGGAGLTAWLTSRSNKTILRRLLPTVVAFSTISSADASDAETSLNQLVRHISCRQNELGSAEKKHANTLRKCFPGIAP
jgi:hypothetical protein